MERIWGPLNGFYVAAYAAPVGDGSRFCSYAKVCWTRPDNYWEADCAFKLFGGEDHRSLEEALRRMVLRARNEVSHLPPHACALALRRQRHQVAIPRLFVTTLLRQRAA